MIKTNRPRNRLGILVLIAVVITLGLASRRFPSVLPSFLGKYPGDALWALMVFLGWAFVKPAASTRNLAMGALATSYIIEFTQLYQAPWINAIRGTTIGHLVLGSVFSWRDLCAYTVGIAVGAFLDRMLFGRVPRPTMESSGAFSSEEPSPSAGTTPPASK